MIALFMAKPPGLFFDNIIIHALLYNIQGAISKFLEANKKEV